MNKLNQIFPGLRANLWFAPGAMIVVRPSNGAQYLLQSSARFVGIQFGLGTDPPVAADHDGDGRADVAVFR